MSAVLPDRRWPRLALAALAAAGAGALLVEGLAVRGIESRTLAAALRSAGWPALVYRPRPDLLFVQTARHGGWAGLVITAKCTSGVFLAPLLAVVAVLLAAGRLGAARLLAACAAAATVMLSVNLGRLVLIALAGAEGGRLWFEWAHEVVGSWLSVLGVAAGGLLFWRIAVKGRTESGREVAACSPLC